MPNTWPANSKPITRSSCHRLKGRYTPGVPISADTHCVRVSHEEFNASVPWTERQKQALARLNCSWNASGVIYYATDDEMVVLNELFDIDQDPAPARPKHSVV